MTKELGQTLFQKIGGEAGCQRLAKDFYARVALDPELRPLFPGKTLRCATEEFAAFLIQFFSGDESKTQYRWWLSLRESHARFQISPSQKAAWLKDMNAALEVSVADGESRAELSSFFEAASSHILGSDETDLANPQVKELWERQRGLDRLIECIASGCDAEAMAYAAHHASRRSVTVGIMARMIEAGREPLIGFVLDSLDRAPSLATARFNGRALIHFAAGSGCLPVLQAVLATGADPNVLDLGGHSPLYRVANGCGTEIGPPIVRELVRAGALVDLCGGVTRSTPLHAAARWGHLAIAMTLVDAGASLEVRDSKGFTPLDRAQNCRRFEVAAALSSRGM